ncbi:hypothetical protein [Methylocystis parvus]|uniref:DUF1269 domain-containing protein n=1 Tax=Methylocystis parvus TaxID=134 RepID=A0A6B8M7N0_9HYPH|nr:hypothetical protein [Methylocystis parvus]QGM98526.1 hypothetical protein F7D14_14275 [Methylocystis parvus]WBK01136.1 general stress protein [Methylocystis parvus OBBP]
MERPLTPEERGKVREVVGVFDNLDQMQSAIDDLLTDGFDQTTISVLAPQTVVREALGDQSLSAEALGANPHTPHGTYIDPEARNEAKAGIIGALFYIGAVGGAGMVLAAGGALGAAIAAALVLGGGGGLVGATLAQLIGSAEATWVKAQMEHGGMLLWARAWDEAKERAAIDVMQRNGGHDVHTHAATA